RAGGQRIAWQVAGGRLERHSHLDIDQARWLSAQRTQGPDGRALLEVIAYELREKKDTDRVVPQRRQEGEGPAGPSTTRGRPITLSLLGFSGRGLKVEQREHYLFESGEGWWAYAFGPDGKGVAWCLDGERVPIWDFGGDKPREHRVLSVAGGVS